MQKKIIALAVASLAAGSAFAQSTNVTLSGIATVSYNNYKVSDTARPASTENRLDDNTSRFTLKGTEDLGNGLSAYFQIENRVSFDSRPNSTFGNAQGLADGETFVGVKSSTLGQIGFGKFAMHYHEGIGYSEQYRALNTQAYASAGILSEMNGTYIAGSTRQQNTIKYDTPNFAGFSAKIAYSFSAFGSEGTLSNTGITGACSNQYTNSTAACGPTAAVNNGYSKGNAWNIAGRYNKGPINAVLSVYEFNPEFGTSTLTGHAGGQKSWKAHFDYNFPFGLQAGLGYDHSKVMGVTSSGDASRNAWMIPLSYATGAHKFYLTYAKAGNRSNVSASGARQYTLAYDYALSKRTFAGVSYVSLANQQNASYQPWLTGISTLGGSQLTVGENARTFGLNLTHFF